MSWLENTFGSPDCLSANIIATATSEGVHLYLVPRHRSYSYAAGFVGLVGGLEILGELVLSTDEEKRGLDRGKFDYDTVAGILAAVEPPAIGQCIERIAAGKSAGAKPQHPASEQQAHSMVGVLAVGGEGRRYQPNAHKHLAPVFDKPAFFYLVAQLMQAEIREIIIVCSEGNRFETEERVRHDLTGDRGCGVTFSFCNTPSAYWDHTQEIEQQFENDLEYADSMRQRLGESLLALHRPRVGGATTDKLRGAEQHETPPTPRRWSYD